MGIPEVGQFRHGELRILYALMEKMSIGEKISVDYKIGRMGKGILSRRAGIRVVERKNGDQMDIFRVA